ncbi:unnamed protein product [Lasius platythorax]|uniref:Uncharacterized protein n=1 Tax=Lasius platythorax TaxID=488582 RepID=A0AAV2N0G8_9HYME
MGEAQSPDSSAQVFAEIFKIIHMVSSNTDYLPQFCSMMKESMQKQQEMISQLVVALTIGQRPPQVHSQHDSPVATPRDMDPHEKFSAMAGNAVKFLSS